MRQDVFNEILDSLENDDMWLFAKKLINTIPPYIYEVGASSSGKYHPQYTLGKGGLIKHTLAVVRLLNYIFKIECINYWSSRERDVLRIAGLMHDSRKSGSQEDYEQNKYTRHEHPLLAAEIVRGFLGCRTIPDKEIKLIASIIETHMGEFNISKYSSVILPKPKTNLQKMLHLTDYLASRKDIEILIDTGDIIKDKLNTYQLNFGKYFGKTILEIAQIDPTYLVWLDTKSELGQKQPLKTLLQQYQQYKET